MQKWQSSIASIESTIAEDQGNTITRSQEGAQQCDQDPWYSVGQGRGLLQFSFEQCITADHYVTKRKMLGVINSIYDLLDLALSHQWWLLQRYYFMKFV